jgi:alpha-glucosidase
LSETFEKQPETGGNYEPLGAAELLDHDDRGLRVRAGATTVEVAALAPDLFRVGMFPAGALPRYDSEGIAKEDWGTIEVSMQESDEELTLSTTAAIARRTVLWVRRAD